MTRAQILFLSRVVIDGSRRRPEYSNEFIEIIEGLIEMATAEKASEAVVLLEAERVRRSEMYRNVQKLEPNAVKRFLASA